MKPVDPEVYRMALDRIDVMRTALRKIAKGEGPFSMDQLEHASNTIDAMKALAVEALELVSITDAWDNAPLDANGIPIPPTPLQREVAK